MTSWVRDMKLPDAEILKVNNRRGGFIGCWWDISSLPLSPGAEAYLQLEEKLLCFKVSVDQKEDRSRVRQAFLGGGLGRSEGPWVQGEET